MEDLELEITEFTAIEPIVKSIETLKNISIEHAYSEEIVCNDKQENTVIDTSPSDTSAYLEEEESTLDSEVPLSLESKPELSQEQVAEKVKSRELKSLLDAAKESNLDTNIVHKRESRKSVDPYGCKPSDNHESPGKRTMRSQNADLSVKQQKNLHKMTKFDSSDSIDQNNENEQDSILITKSLKRKKDDDDSIFAEENKKNRKFNIIKDGKDSFCWRCHRDGTMVHCETCPRAYHTRCLKQPVSNPERWPCPECLAILQAESTKTRSAAMRDMPLEHLCELLKYAVKRMIGCAGSEPFIHPVDLKTFPDYRNYVVQPMDLTTLQSNIRNNLYGSTVAFMADAKWILHNSIIYNSYQSKLTSAAKSITKICKQEMSEIETCAECYQNANTKKNSWFVEVCLKPHILLWAKLKGFPYWPAKAMTINAAGLVDVRFFGAHDRAWIPVKECFLYSKKDPNTTNKNKRNNIAECIKEVDIHIEKLKEKYGDFCHAPYRTLYDPNAEMEQLKFMLPKYKFNSKIKSHVSIVKASKKEQEDNEKNKIKTSKSNSPESSLSRDDSFQKKSDSAESTNDTTESKVRSDISEDTDVLSSSSKTSLLNDDKLDINVKFTAQDFDKFMEGYGTEDDETTALTLNDEVRKKIIQYESDSEEDSSISSKINSNLFKDVERKEDINYLSSPEKLTNNSKIKVSMLTPENYSKLSGKVRIIRTKRSIDSNRKRNSSNTRSESESPIKIQRRNSDISTTSDSSRISALSDKISRVEEFSDTLEVSLANTSKDSAIVSFSENISPEKKSIPESSKSTELPDLTNLKPIIQVCTGDLFNKNKDFKISPQNKSSISIADRLMKKITNSEVCEMDKVEAVKKQILENLETTSSSQVSNENLTNDLVSSSNIDKENVDSVSELVIDETEIITDPPDKNQNVSSSTETNSEVQKNSKTSENSIIVAKNLNCAEKENSTKNVTKKLESHRDNATEKSFMAIISDDSGSSDEEDSESGQSLIIEKSVDSSLVKLVNVSDILSGKINGNTPVESMINKSQKSSDSIEVKSEPLSDEDHHETEKVKPDTKQIISSDDDDSEDKQTEDTTLKVQNTTQFKVIDNLTRVIDSVASDYNTPLSNKKDLILSNKREISLRPISKLIHSPKQRARKSFPNSPHSINHVSMVKRMITERKDAFTYSKSPSIGNVKVVSSLQNIQPQPTTHVTSNVSSNNKDNMLYITSQQTPVINNMALLPPNQPITLTQNVGSPILAMVQHHGINTPSLIIQQNPTPTNSLVSTPTSQCSIVTPLAITSTVVSNVQTTNTAPISSIISLPQTSEQNSISILSDDRSGISEHISKAVGDLFCRPPPVLKPRPAGPLSTFFDEGIPSTAGPTTKLINSISHRLSDYFRGFLTETFQDLSTIGSPEAKIRSLELEIETLKHKHNEEMIELRKNISSVLKDIQKSIVEDKAKIVDETRTACEAERLRCVEETKSKQWCAYCLKEAQFYCCWNTSYCDYPCQQKHWPAHMNTCSQARNAPSGANSNSIDKSSMNIASKLTKAVNANNKTMLKPARMIVKQTSKQGLPMYVPVQRSLHQAGQQTLTLVESTPGNFEIVGNHGPISLGGKIVPTTTIKMKPGNVITVASSSTNNTISSGGTPKTIILSQQKAPQIIHKSSTENKT